MNRILLHFDDQGFFEVHADEPVTFIVCSDLTPSDWAYQMSGISIGTVDDVLGDAVIGHVDDDKQETAELHILYGKPKEVN